MNNRLKFGLNSNHMSNDNQNIDNSPKQPENRVIIGKNGNVLKPFQKGNTMSSNGRGLGNVNRSTILKKWLTANTTGQDVDGNIINLSVQDKIVLAQVKKALDGDTGAAIFLFDGAYGKVKEVIQQTNTNTEIDYSKFSADELRVMEQAQRIMAGKLNEQRNSGVQDAEIVE